jgi:hypothetical protein
MTHSGGKPHAVGDKAQRYEVTAFDTNKNERIVIGWTNDPETARNMADGAILRPSWAFPQVRDRSAP